MSSRRLMLDPDVTADVAVGNDKTIEVAAGKTAEFISARVLVTTTATVGNRQLRFEVRDSSNNVLYGDDATSTVAASQTDVEFFVHVNGDPVALERLFAPPGGDFRFYDSANVDASDTFKVYGLVMESTAGEL